jgi:hypothetical protein
MTSADEVPDGQDGELRAGGADASVPPDVDGSQGSSGGLTVRLLDGGGRLVRVWRALPHERRLAAIAAIGLFVVMFLPWYQQTVIATGSKHLLSASESLNAWQAFSFVEAAVLLIAAGVLTLLFQRAEGRAFHLPGGDGWVIMAAGLWTCVLIVWRMFDNQGSALHGQYADTWGIDWGIFIALFVAAFLTYTGSRIRAAHRAEPPLPGEVVATGVAAGAAVDGPTVRRARTEGPPSETTGEEPRRAPRRARPASAQSAKPVRAPVDVDGDPNPATVARDRTSEPESIRIRRRRMPGPAPEPPDAYEPPTEPMPDADAYEPPTEPMPDADATKVSGPSARAGEPTIRRVTPPATSAARARRATGSERQSSRDTYENDLGLDEDLRRQQPPDRPAG